MDLFEKNQETKAYSQRTEMATSQDEPKSPPVIYSRTPTEWDEQIRTSFETGGNDPNTENEYGVPLLFHAINFGTVEVMRILLNAGADVNFVSWQGHSPWFLAVESRDMGKIRMLEKFHADPSIQNNLGHSALHLTAMRGDVRLFHYLIHHASATSQLAVNHWGNSLLHLTASWHRHLLTRICLTHTQIPVDLQNYDGETALLKAVKSGEIAIARLIMNAGGDINMADKNGFHPLTASLRYIKINDEALCFLTDMLAAGAKPDVCNRYGETPLFLAVKRHWKEAVELLLRYPVDVHHMADPELRNQKDSMMSPIMMAGRGNHLEIAKMLLAAHADANAIFNKKSLLYHAVEQHLTAMAELLLDFGANGKYKSPENVELATPIQLAIQKEYRPVIELFVKKVKNPFEEPETRKFIDKISNTELRDALLEIADANQK